MSHNNVFRTAGNISAARQNYSAGLRAAEPIELASDDNDEIQRKILEMEEMLPDEEIPDSPLSSSHRKHSKQVEYVNTNANDEYSSDEEGSIVFFEQGFPNQIQHSSASTLLMTMSDIEIQSSASLDPNTLEAIDFEEYKNMVSKREALREAPVSPTPEIEESKNSPLKITIKKQSPNGKPLFIDVKQPSRSASIEDLPNSVSREQRGSADSIISPPIVSPREEVSLIYIFYSSCVNLFLIATCRHSIPSTTCTAHFPM